MGRIGSFGSSIIFETSDAKILNFNSFSRQVSSSWTTHDRLGLKPRSEFMGANLQTVSFNVELNAQHGVRPRAMLEVIEDAIEDGNVEVLVIGAKRIGYNKWKITQMSETWDVIMAGGELQKATVQLTLEEYV